MKATWDIICPEKDENGGGIWRFILKYPLQRKECVPELGLSPNN